MTTGHELARKIRPPQVFGIRSHGRLQPGHPMADVTSAVARGFPVPDSLVDETGPTPGPIEMGLPDWSYWLTWPNIAPCRDSGPILAGTGARRPVLGLMNTVSEDDGVSKSRIQLVLDCSFLEQTEAGGRYRGTTPGTIRLSNLRNQVDKPAWCRRMNDAPPSSPILSGAHSRLQRLTPVTAPPSRRVPHEEIIPGHMRPVRGNVPGSNLDAANCRDCGAPREVIPRADTAASSQWRAFSLLQLNINP